MVNHDGEWVCHSTHRLTELEEAVETKNIDRADKALQYLNQATEP